MDRPPDIAKPKPVPPMIAFTNVVTLKFIYPPYPDDLQRPSFLQANEIMWFTIFAYFSEITDKMHHLLSYRVIYPVPSSQISLLFIMLALKALPLA